MVDQARILGRGAENRLELLLFSLGGSQTFGINVLKIKEVIPCPHLTQVPQAHHAVRGVAHLRGEPLTVIDLSSAVGRGALGGGADCSDLTVIITEFNRSMQGFLVQGVDRIMVCDWQDVLPPPRATGVGSYTTGVTRVDDRLVQILDVEKVLGEVAPVELQIADDRLDITAEHRSEIQGRRVLVVDDSSLARSQTVHTLEPLGVECLLAQDGRDALELLKKRIETEGEPPVDMVISDIEMPEMDGYTLTRAIREDERLRRLPVLLHTSLNGAINGEKAQQCGADDFLTKFVPEDLAEAVVRGLTHT